VDPEKEWVGEGGVRTSDEKFAARAKKLMNSGRLGQFPGRFNRRPFVKQWLGHGRRWLFSWSTVGHSWSKSKRKFRERVSPEF